MGQTPREGKLPRRDPEIVRLASLNVNGLTGKVEELERCVVDNDVDLLFLTETWQGQTTRPDPRLAATSRWLGNDNRPNGMPGRNSAGIGIMLNPMRPQDKAALILRGGGAPGEAMCCEFKGMEIGGLYLNPRLKGSECIAILETMGMGHSKPSIIMGDWNIQFGGIARNLGRMDNKAVEVSQWLKDHRGNYTIMRPGERGLIMSDHNESYSNLNAEAAPFAPQTGQPRQSALNPNAALFDPQTRPYSPATQPYTYYHHTSGAGSILDHMFGNIEARKLFQQGWVMSEDDCGGSDHRMIVADFVKPVITDGIGTSPSVRHPSDRDYKRLRMRKLECPDTRKEFVSRLTEDLRPIMTIIEDQLLGPGPPDQEKLDSIEDEFTVTLKETGKAILGIQTVRVRGGHVLSKELRTAKRERRVAFTAMRGMSKAYGFENPNTVEARSKYKQAKTKEKGLLRTELRRAYDRFAEEIARMPKAAQSKVLSRIRKARQRDTNGGALMCDERSVEAHRIHFQQMYSNAEAEIGVAPIAIEAEVIVQPIRRAPRRQSSRIQALATPTTTEVVGQTIGEVVTPGQPGAEEEEAHAIRRGSRFEFGVMNGSERGDDERDRFSIANIEKFMRKAAGGKAPGRSGVSLELLRGGGLPILKLLSKLFELCWKWELCPKRWHEATALPVPKKGDLSKIENHRPIMLTEVARKIFEKCILVHDLAHIDPGLDIAQGGFRHGRGAPDQVACLHEAIQIKKRVLKREPLMAFLDITAAYDTVCRPILWEKLHRKGVTPKMITLLQALFEQNSSYLQVRGVESGAIRHERGLLQGSILSPILYAVFIDDLAGKLRAVGGTMMHDEKLASFFYADDIALVADTQPKLQRMLEICEAHAREHRYKFAPAKCKIIAPVGTSAKIQGETLEIVENFTYLGVPVGKNGINEKLFVKTTATKAQQAITFFRGLGLNGTGLKWSAKMSIFKTFLRPKLEYGLPLLGKTNASLLQLSMNYALRCMFSVPMSCSTAGLLALTGATTVEQRRVHLTRKFMQRVVQAPDNHMKAQAWKAHTLKKMGRSIFTQAKKIPWIKDNLQLIIDRQPVPSENEATNRGRRVLYWTESYVREVQPLPTSAKDSIVWKIDKLTIWEQNTLFRWILRRPRGEPPRCTFCVMARHATVHHIQSCTGRNIDSLILESKLEEALLAIREAYSECYGGSRARFVNTSESLATRRGITMGAGSGSSDEDEVAEMDPSMTNPDGPLLSYSTPMAIEW